MARLVTFRGRFTAHRATHRVEKLVGPPPHRAWGGFPPKVGASEQTRARDAVGRRHEVTRADKLAIVAAMRRVGFAAWLRPETPGVWGEHIHAIPIGGDLSPPPPPGRPPGATATTASPARAGQAPRPPGPPRHRADDLGGLPRVQTPRSDATTKIGTSCVASPPAPPAACARSTGSEHPLLRHPHRRRPRPGVPGVAARRQPA